MTATATKATEAEAPVSNTSPLTGEALLDKFEVLKTTGMAPADIAVECGYYIKVSGGERAGEVRASNGRFHEAILVAQGVLPAKKEGGGGGARSSAKRVRLNPAGRGSLTAGMLEPLGAKPGDCLVPTVLEHDGVTGLFLTIAA